MAKQKILIIVVTRADIPRGRGDDEFIENWGQGKNQNIYWFKNFLIDAGNVYILVIHGCNDNSKKYPILFQEAEAKKGADFFKRIDKVYLCYHGMKQNNLKTLQDSITNLLEKAKHPTTLSYSSSNNRHNFAIFDLLDQLEGKYQLAGLRNEVFDQLRGRTVIIQQLHCLQSELLRLQFCIATVVSISNDSKQSAIEDAQDAVSEITKVLQREGFKNYYHEELEELKLQPVVVKETTKAFGLLFIFLTHNLQYKNNKDVTGRLILQNVNYWTKPKEIITYNNLSIDQLPSLERDFRFLAHAVDCLLDAASIDTEDNLKKRTPQQQ